MGQPRKQGKRKTVKVPTWYEQLNWQVWKLRRIVTFAAWVFIGGVVVLVGLEVWRVLR